MMNSITCQILNNDRSSEGRAHVVRTQVKEGPRISRQPAQFIVQVFDETTGRCRVRFALSEEDARALALALTEPGQDDDPVVRLP